MRRILTVFGAISIFANFAFAEPQESKDTTSNQSTNQEERADDWVSLGKHNNSMFFLQKNSLKVLNFPSGKALRMTMQTDSPEGLLYSNLFFWTQSCKQKQGEVAYFNLNQTKSQTSMVVVGGKDIGSKAVTIMCNDYEHYTKHLSTMTEQELKENNEWQDIAITDKLITSYKRDSNEIILDKDDKKKKHIQLSGRLIDLSDKKVILQKWFTPLEDCEAEIGVLHTYDLSKNSYSFNNYAFHSGSMASLIAEDLCKNIEGAKDKTK